jgi:glycosyltransferase involved in cell wall biosynthesis
MLSLRALRIEAEDALRYSPAMRQWLTRGLLLRALCSPRQTPRQLARTITHLCAAARLEPSLSLQTTLEALIRQRVRTLRRTHLDWPTLLPNATIRRIENAVVLKPHISQREPGVVFIAFEYQWARLLATPNLAEFARDYQLVVSPSWSPPHTLVNCLFPELYPGPVFSLISNERDLTYLPRLSENYVMVPLLASNWVNPALFQPCDFANKTIDIVMIANFGKFKRHHALFRALRDLPNTLRVSLIGFRDGQRLATHLHAEARAYGVGGRYVLYEYVPYDVVRTTLPRAKVALVLSRREGSCVSAVESLLANTPLGLYEDAEVGSRRYINPQTGRLLQHTNLAPQLSAFLADAHRYQPRQWALDNAIDCHGSTAILNDALERYARANGQEWTRDIAVMTWQPKPCLLDPADRQRLEPAYNDIHQRFGLHFG